MQRSSRFSVILAFGVVLACFPFMALAKGQVPASPPQRIMRPMMGTLVEVLWRGPEDSGRAETVHKTMAQMDALAGMMSLKQGDSFVAKINSAAGKTAVQVPEALIQVIETSLNISKLTGGAFDITVGALETAWGDIQFGQGGRLPGKEEINAALSKVDYNKIVLNNEDKSVFLKLKGTRIDLGGIAKGYIIGHGLQRLNEGNIESALINAGGDISASSRQGDPLWRVGLQDPFEKGKLLGVFLIDNGAVVTSGSYERFYETQAGTYTHILDPATGQPVKKIVSVTILADDAAFADGLATALMVASPEAGMALINKSENVHGVIIDVGGTIWIDKRLKQKLQLTPLSPEKKVRFF